MTKQTEILTDPIAFGRIMWPDVKFYDKQVQVIESVVEDDMTVVPAGNMLGKDFIAGYIIVWFFCSRSPCRIITTSAKDDHLRVLWGEINNFIQSSKYPLTVDKGGPLVVHHREILRRLPDGSVCPKSYVRGMVASLDTIASMQGHHVADVGDGVPRTLFVSDESSSVPDEYWTMARTWAKRALILGNPWPCANFFFQAVRGNPATGDKGGDLFSDDGKRCYRRVIRIRAEDSPNVRLAEAEKAKGRKPSGRTIIPGVKGYDTYLKDRKTWDGIQQTVSLDAQFYMGSELYLFPQDWIQRAIDIAARIRLRGRGGDRTMGVDVAEGGDSTSWTIIDDKGILKQLSMKTPDTSVIAGHTIRLQKEWNVIPERTLFDRGGGGKQHADYLRTKGCNVRTVGFGERATDPKVLSRSRTIRERLRDKEVAYTFRNRRAEMFWMVRLLLDPLDGNEFGIPGECAELIRQMRPIPLQFDTEGRIKIPSKNKRGSNSTEVTLTELLGCSPDELDSLALAAFGHFYPSTKRKARVFA